MEDLGAGRCKRFAAFYDDGELKVLAVAEGGLVDGVRLDPAGDDDPSSTFAENFLPRVPVA